MICTEEEAKTKWCPLVRANPLGATQEIPEMTTRNFLETPKRAGHGNCIGSACMFWVNKPSSGRFGANINTGYCGAIAAAYTPSSTI